jgi:hypothetical protein
MSVHVIEKDCGCRYIEETGEYIHYCDLHRPADPNPRYKESGIAQRHPDMADIDEVRMDVAVNDVIFLQEREKLYGSSWKKRGGVGAFMMLARKWDRLENILKEPVFRPGIGSAGSYDIFQFIHLNPANVLDDVRDLRRYLLLVEAEMVHRGHVHIDKPSEPGPAESRGISGVLQAKTQSQRDTVSGIAGSSDDSSRRVAASDT